MSKRDYYEVLGVDRGVDARDLKKAYRRMAQKYHPDRNQGDESAEEKFKEAKEAYEILGDEQKRRAYDQFGHAGVDPTMGGAGGAGAGGFEDIFGGVFNDIFGGARRGRQGGVHRGADLRYPLELSLEDAVAGISANIEIPTEIKCGDCGGSGAKKGTAPTVCDTCRGNGQIRMQQGFFSVQQTCPACHGQGKVIRQRCPPCRGSGKVAGQPKTLSVKVPAGVDSGDRIRLSSEGKAGEHGGPPGDLYIEISVKQHPIFNREGSHLYCEMPISFAVAALGDKLEVPTLTGKVSLKIPAGTQTGKTFCLRGKGVKSVRGGPLGDLFCTVVVQTPVKMTTKQKRLLRDFDDSIKK